MSDKRDQGKRSGEGEEGCMIQSGAGDVKGGIMEERRSWEGMYVCENEGMAKIRYGEKG